jgi:hypothetical protein
MLLINGRQCTHRQPRTQAQITKNRNTTLFLYRPVAKMSKRAVIVHWRRKLFHVDKGFYVLYWKTVPKNDYQAICKQIQHLFHHHDGKCLSPHPQAEIFLAIAPPPGLGKLWRPGGGRGHCWNWLIHNVHAISPRGPHNFAFGPGPIFGYWLCLIWSTIRGQCSLIG